MSGNEINRRRFLKTMGWSGAGVALAGCDLPTTVTLEEGKETVVSYLMPEEYVIPGRGAWYASTCQQCAAGCGLHGRVREGRVLKLEGNPDAAIGQGGLCQMGQAGVQAHYNPDRLREPMMKKGGTLTKVSWDEALEALDAKIANNGNKVAWLTGTVSGHQAVLLDAYNTTIGSSSHYIHEIVNNAVGRVVNKDMFGEVQPTYHLAKAKAVLSFGSDFLGASLSPVQFSREYAEFRTAPRGMLIQIEPKMTLTGANADLWVPARPGTEGVLALGIANLLINQHGMSGAGLSADASSAIAAVPAAKAAEVTGVPEEQIKKIANVLKERSPSLVLTGAATEGHANGYAAAAAAMTLNVILGNVGETVTSAGDFPFPQMAPRGGNTRDLLAFAEGAGKGAFDVAIFYGTNPVYTAPDALKINDSLDKVPFKVALSHFKDETTAQADLVLPLDSALEDWGTHVALYQPEQATIGVQQPLMEKMYDTKGLGDILLTLLKKRKVADYEQFDDYYAYLANAFSAMPDEYKNGMSNQAFWNKSLQTGTIAISANGGTLGNNAVSVKQAGYQENVDYPMHLIPAARLGLWDGRHANLPWLQEAPDQISKVVWGSWAEIHPRTAQRLGVNNGDYIKVASAQGSVEVPVYIHRGIHPDAVAVPLGQGHTEYGRYAKGVGVNPLKILDPITDQKTGELAMYATRVKVEKTTPAEKMVRFGGSDTQVGRKLVASIPADVFNRTEGA